MLNLVILPQWVEQSVLDAGKSLRDVTNQEVLLSTLSMDDVGKYLAINTEVSRFFPVEVAETFKVGAQLFTFLDGNQDLQDAIISHSIKMQNTDSDKVKLDDMFGVLDELGPDDVVTYEVITIDPDTLAIIPRKNSGLSFNDMLEELMIHLKGRMSFSDTAKTPLFRLILKLL